VFDADGDGRDEVLVWRTDRDGHGALMIYQFADGALPLRTIGPAYGVSSAGALAFVVRAPAGERLLVTALAPERLVVRQFDEQGLLAQFDAARLPPDLLAQALATARRDGPPRAGDLDGDGSAETVVLVR
jgi:hypothetical protein